jgi:cell division protein divIVA, putative
LQERIEHANRELAATQSFAPLDEEIVKAHQEELFRTESDEEDDSEGSQRIPINIL